METDFSIRPLNIYWEMTQACALSCRHCRASAMPWAHPDELTTDQALDFLAQIPSFGTPLPRLILTGGDPLQRPDLFTLIAAARHLEIPVAITPAVTPKLTQTTVDALRAAGVEALGISLDGSSRERHEAIRQVEGTFERTLQALSWGRQAGLDMQVNTLVSAQTVDDIPAIYELLRPTGIRRWSLFFLIPMGRGSMLGALTPQRAETLMRWALDTAATAPFMVATTEAPSYRRLSAQRQGPPPLRRHPHAAASGIRDGHGVLFVSHRGEICPSGFLPLPAGNVRRDQLVEIYRHGPIFSELHDPDGFHGLCGLCAFRGVCGGSRARAYAATGDWLASDPLCTLVAAGRPQACCA